MLHCFNKNTKTEHTCIAVKIITQIGGFERSLKIYIKSFSEFHKNQIKREFYQM